MKKVIFWISVVANLVCIALLLRNCGTALILEADVKRITDPAQYEYNSVLQFYECFPREIPDNAKTVQYGNSSYYSDRDIYLTLTFYDRDSMEDYLTELKKSTEKRTVIMENPYNATYTDIFIASTFAISGSGDGEKEFQELRFDGSRKDFISFSTIYAVISYSYEDLTVISNGSNLHCVESFQNFIFYPYYLHYHNVDFHQAYEREIAFDRD